NGLRPSAVDATYRSGRMEAKVNRFGVYSVMADTVAPKVVPQKPEQWAQRGVVTYKISDNLSGISTYRGEIDGKWALMELDGKTGTLSFKLDKQKWPAGRHTIVLTVTDACGNETISTRSF
ncbi:MAG: M23 family peptidase, partial [Muribaculaceae bacterium]|nr:M23 family peptidase [Muribaculaceae bacterium]